MVKIKNFNKNDSVDASFTVKRNQLTDGVNPTQKKVMGGGFFSGIKRVGRGVKVAAKAGGKAVVKTGRATAKGVIAAGKTSASARRIYYEKRHQALERKQNISTLKANIAQQKFLTTQGKIATQEAKLKKLELAKARRDFLRSQREERQGLNRRSAPLADRKVSYRGLSDRKPGIPRKRGGFFD